MRANSVSAAGTIASTIMQDLRLPGQEFDAANGINHNGFRDYLPAYGRYLESDPIGLAGDANTYAHSAGNPLKYVDRSGLDSLQDMANGFTGGQQYSLPPSIPTPIALQFGSAIQSTTREDVAKALDFVGEKAAGAAVPSAYFDPPVAAGLELSGNICELAAMALRYDRPATNGLNLASDSLAHVLHVDKVISLYKALTNWDPTK